MTSFQLFKELTGVDPELLESIEGRDVRNRTGLPVKKIFLIAAVVALTLLLVGCAVAYANGWLQMVFTARSEQPLSGEQIEYIQNNEQTMEQTQTMDDWTIDLKSTISDGQTSYLVFRITAPESMDLEQYLHSPTQGNKRLSMGNYSASRKAGYSYVVASIGTVDPQKNYCYNEHGTWHSDGDGKANTILFFLTISCEKLDSSKPMLLEDPFGKDISFRIRLMGLTLEYENTALAQEIDKKYAGQEYLIDGQEAAGLFLSDILTDEEWNFDVTFTPDNQFIELINQPISVQTKVLRYADEKQWDTTESQEEMQITSFRVTPFGARITYAPNPGAAAFSPTLSEDAGHGIYAIMKDGSRIKLNAAGMEPTALTAESPIILSQLDYVLLEDGTKLFANIQEE